MFGLLKKETIRVKHMFKDIITGKKIVPITLCESF